MKTRQRPFNETNNRKLSEFFKLLCLTRKLSSRMQSAHFSDSWGVPLWTQTPWTQTHLDTDPLDTDHLLDTDPLDRDRHPDIDPPWAETPRRNMGQGTETSLEGTWDQAARQEVTSYRDPPVNRITQTCKNITCTKFCLRTAIKWIEQKKFWQKAGLIPWSILTALTVVPQG